MKKNFHRALNKIVFILLMFVSFLIKSQSLSMLNQGGVNYIYENCGSNQAGIVPVSGNNLIPNCDSRIVLGNEKNNINIFNWVLKFSVPGKVFKDVSFVNPLVGFIVTELGAVYKTSNGGDNWTNVMNLGFPYYWYGVYALTVDTVVIAGFNNQGNIHSGVIRWTFNGGVSWTNDITLIVPSNGVGWLTRIFFFDRNKGIVSNEFSGGIYYTTNGGKDSSSWHYVQVNQDLGWFAGNIDAHTNGSIYTTGIHFSNSTDYGITWTSGPSADGTFDGGVDFIDNNLLKGMTGGGSISPTVAGWVHRTTNGGQTWSPRLNNFPYPIRAVKYFSDTIMLVFGGNVNSETGGIFSSSNAGVSWNLEVNTSAEMFSYDFKVISSDSIDIWSVGSTGGSTGFTGKCYKSRFGNIVGINNSFGSNPDAFRLSQNFPNPFNPLTIIKYDLLSSTFVKLSVFDLVGREVRKIVNEMQNPGSYKVEFDGNDLPGGVYFYRILTGRFSETKKMILIK